MKALALAAGAAFATVGLAAAAPGDQAEPSQEAQETTITAQVVDQSCYLANGLKGADHKMCAEVCAKKGIPLVLLGDDGQIYLPVDTAMPGAAFNEQLLPHAEAKVKVTGKVVEKSGSKAIVVKKITAA
ncbi:MAG: hypothetical protein ACE5JR_05480 [Gemmatimonadota bacterium]